MENRTVANLASVGTGAVVIAAAVFVATSFGGPSLGGGRDSLEPVLQASLALGWAIPGVILARRRSGLPFWWLAQIAAATHGLAAIVIATSPENRWFVWVASWLVVVELPALAAMVQLFPTGRPLPGWRLFLAFSVLAGMFGVVAVAVEARPGPGSAARELAGQISVPLLAFAAIGGVVPLAIRFRRTVAGERRAVAWLLAIMGAGVVIPAIIVAGGQRGEVVAQVFTVAQLAFISVAVVRYRVWGLAPMMQRSLQRVVAATDSERGRIRAELHDGVGAGLTAVRLKVDAAAQLIAGRPDRAAEMLSSASTDIGTVLDDVRRLIEGLRPAVLDRMELGAALRQRADELSAHAPDLSFVVVDSGHLAMLPPGADVSVYRLVTEAMNNVVRHAGATRCDVRVTTQDGEIVVDVSDNGSGRGGPAGDGVGLSSMAARASEVGGYVIVDDDPAGGFRVHVVIPVGAP